MVWIFLGPVPPLLTYKIFGVFGSGCGRAGERGSPLFSSPERWPVSPGPSGGKLCWVRLTFHLGDSRFLDTLLEFSPNIRGRLG